MLNRTELFGLLFLLCFTITQIDTALIQDEVRNSTEFSLNFYRHFVDLSSNAVVSPLSFRILLSLVYQSATGQVENDLREKLYFSDNKHEAFQSQKLSLDKIRESPIAKILNKIYLRNSGSLNNKFREIIENYESEVEQIDFKQKSEAIKTINKWISENTNGLIKEVVSDRSIDDNVVVLLVNSLYFKAKWAEPFEKDSINNLTFFGIDGVNRTTQFMIDSRTADFTSVRSLQSKVLQLKYETNSGFKAWFILPNPRNNLKNVISLLSSNIIQDVSKNFKPRPLELAIPMFKLESTCNGKNVLRKLGLDSMFELNNLEMVDGDLLKISDAMQKTKIIVDTEGTEITSTTVLGAVGRFLPPEFRTNRPFLFLILTDDTNEIAFIGHYVKPN